MKAKIFLRNFMVAVAALTLSATFVAELSIPASAAVFPSGPR